MKKLTKKEIQAIEVLYAKRAWKILDIAIKDFKTTLSSKEYGIKVQLNMGTYGTGDKNYCEVCFAGNCFRNLCPNFIPFYTNFAKDLQSLDTDNEYEFSAAHAIGRFLDDCRTGDIKDGLQRLYNDLPSDLYGLPISIPTNDGNGNRELFIRQMERIRDLLKKAGV